MHQLDDITGAVVDESMKLHRVLGPGLLESVYESVLARALVRRGFDVARQKAILFEYDGELFEEGFRADLLVEGRAIVELKSVERLAPVHKKQLLTYLRVTHLQVGLLVNFGAATLTRILQLASRRSKRSRGECSCTCDAVRARLMRPASDVERA